MVGSNANAEAGAAANSNVDSVYDSVAGKCGFVWFVGDRVADFHGGAGAIGWNRYGKGYRKRKNGRL